MRTLHFVVVACTSEDAAFPASTLDPHDSTRKGYMTAKYRTALFCRQIHDISARSNCSYPQELVLQLQDGRCRVHQVQLLSHQTHIATKIDVFLSLNLSFHGDATRFSRLGFFTLKANTESNYSARELKTVHINQDAVLLKLRIHSCHVNEHNVYNQVGIMAITLCGEPLELLPHHSTRKASVVAQSTNHTNREGMGELTFDQRFDAKTAARIHEIQVAKDQAVASEDYDQAKRLKQMEDHFKSIGVQLARLEAEKRDAVAKEDYDQAKQIKLEIKRLEATLSSTETQPILPVPAVAVSPAIDETRSVAAQSTSLNYLPTRIDSENFQDEESGSANDDDDSNLKQPSQRLLSSNPGLYADGSVDGDQEDGNIGDPNAHFKGIPDAENLPDPDKLPAALAKESEELIAVIGPFLTRCFYSNLWTHRDAAIRKVTMEMDNYAVQPMRLLEVCSIVAQSGAGDCIVPVTLSAFGLLDRMVSFGAQILKDDMCRILDNSMTPLVNKLGEFQSKVRDEAMILLEHFAAAENVGIAFVVAHLTRRSKKALGVKLLLGRLLVLKRFLVQFELVPTSDFSAPGIMGFLDDCNCFAHYSREIRDVAKKITVSLYRAVGNEVEGYLKSLRPKVLEEYQAAFEAAETAKAAARSFSASRRNEELQEGQAHDLDDADSEEEESVDEYTCPFCGVVDEQFDSEYLDRHFWESCRMLTPCKMCGQVIEISSLNEHLLAECEMQHNHRECPRCGEAITLKFYERHVALNDCPARAPLHRANRCPLCHDDILPGKKGWRHHLIDEGCRKNPRK
ncbi:hypothetical protein PsorP6_012051 [Peronosclerospora sorghi]|uniref:Uncharacterized protein n=1 Tax=Peronosclerospora sorghi TaxID=230839 RepID=A0ACC0WKV0_9STRA|nr:hypothetical protein PsorP6_012051 [Peronosclerospora sorghi]